MATKEDHELIFSYRQNKNATTYEIIPPEKGLEPG